MTAPDDPDVAAVARISAVPTILRVIERTTGLRLAVVARVTEDSWKACAVLDHMNFGLAPGDQLDIATTLCREVRDAKKAIVIDCASADPLYRSHPTPELYGFQSYISVPIFLRSGSYFGNVCALDSRPAKLKENDALAMFELFAELIGLQLEAEERQYATEEALLDARQTAELREQFIAVLGHDIRTPLSAILFGAALLSDRGLAAADLKVVQRMRASAGRIARLVDDVLDFARGRLGGGIPLATASVADLGAVFQQVVDEARATHPTREIRFTATACPPVRCDRDRLAQVLSNLLINALEHGSQLSVEVELSCTATDVRLCVTNHGEPIAEHILPRLFLPFSRDAGARPRAGLGLGLYIVSQIMQSHRGRIDVASGPEGTTFTCALPIA